MTIVSKLLGRSGPVVPLERDLLDSIHPAAIPDPGVLRARLDTLHAEIAAAEREWERLDGAGDPSSLLKLTPIAERLTALRAQASPLPAQIDAAERRRSAFLQLARLFDAVAAEVSARTLHLL